jgi:hypothetical protein
MPDPEHRNRLSSRSGAAALCLALLGAGSMLYYHLGLFMPRVLAARATQGLGGGYAFGDDFYPIWLTTRQWQTHRLDLYSAEMTREIQIGLFGRPLDPNNPSDPPADYRTFAYPAFTDLVLWPAADLDFPYLRFVLAALLPLLTAASVWLWMLALDWRALGWRARPLWFAILLLILLCSYPLLEGFFAEQPGLIVGFLLASSALAMRKDWLLLAGSLIALTLMKPQMTLLVIFYLLIWSLAERRRARFWIGFLATIVPLVGASLWIWPHWIERWLKVIFEYPRYATPALVSLLPGSVLGRYVGPTALAGLVGVGGWLAWRNRHAKSDSEIFWWTVSLLLAITSVTLLPGQAIYDQVILYSGILLVIKNMQKLRDSGFAPRTLLAAGAIVLFWPWMTALGLIVTRGWIAPAHFESTAVFALPIRTAASLPFAALALLVYVGRISASGDRAPS